MCKFNHLSVINGSVPQSWCDCVGWCLQWAAIFGLMLACGCQKNNAAIELTEDQRIQAERRAVDALKELGCRVEETEDELIGTAGILVRLYSEHFVEKGFIQPEVLRDLRYLRNCFLIVDGTPISASGVGELRTLNNLLLLSAQRTRIGDDGLQQIEGIVSLRLLRLNWTRITDHGLRHISRLPKLVMLYVSNTPVGDKALDHISILKQLRALQIANTRITDQGIERLLELPGLEFLGLDGTKITDQSVSILQKLQKLRFLDVSETQLSDGRVLELQQALPQCFISRDLTRQARLTP